MASEAKSKSFKPFLYAWVCSRNSHRQQLQANNEASIEFAVIVSQNPMTRQLSFYAQKASQSLISIETYSIILNHTHVQMHWTVRLSTEWHTMCCGPSRLSPFPGPSCFWTPPGSTNWAITFSEANNYIQKDMSCEGNHSQGQMTDESLWLMNVDECWWLLTNAD